MMHDKMLQKQFLDACLNGKLDVVKKLIADHEISNASNASKVWTWVTSLLFYHRTIDVSAKGNHALCNATAKGHLDIVTLLLTIPSVYQNAHAENNDALRWAARNDHLDIVKLLLTIPSVYQNANAGYNGALKCAARNGHLDVVNCLLEVDSVRQNINATYYKNPYASAIALAFENGHHNIVRVLNQNGAVLTKYRRKGPQGNLNGDQSVHAQSFQKCVSDSALNLHKQYKPNQSFVSEKIKAIQNWLKHDFNPISLSKNEAFWLEKAKICMTRLEKIDYTDSRSKVTLTEALALVWTGINNPKAKGENQTEMGSEEIANRKMTLLKALYEIHRSGNLRGDKAEPVDDMRPEDAVTCESGTFNKLIAALAYVGHEGVEFTFVTKDTIFAQATALTKAAFVDLNKDDKAYYANNWDNEKISEKMQQEYFDSIKIIIEKQLREKFDDFKSEIDNYDKIISEAIANIIYVDMSEVIKKEIEKHKIVLSQPNNTLLLTCQNLESKKRKRDNNSESEDSDKKIKLEDSLPVNHGKEEMSDSEEETIPESNRLSF